MKSIYPRLSNYGRSLRVLAVLLTVMVVTLACQISLGGPAAPTERPTTAAGNDWRSTLANAQPGQEVSFTISEAEVNGMLPDEMEASQGITIADPSIVFATSGIQTFGQASNGTISARFRADLDVKVDESGRPRAQITGADFGPMPVPDSLLDDLSTTLDNAMMEAIGPAVQNLRLTDITVLDGALQITGVVQ